MTLVTNTTISVDGGATLNLASSNSVNGAAANANLVLAGGGAGVLSGPLALGSGGVTVSGGTWNLAPGNSFTGLTALNGGTTRINDASLGSPAAFTANQITLGGGALEAVTNATFNDGNAGITLTANATVAVDAGATLTISNEISGASNLTKSSPGTLVLNGSNSFSGILYLDTASNTANDGTTRIASTNALANVPATSGTPTIFENANNSGSSLLQLDGSAGNLNLPQEMRFSCRNNASVNVENLSGSNTFSGNIDINSGGNAVYFQSDSGTLNISGNLQYTGTLNGSRTYFFTGPGNHVVNGVVTAGVNTNAPISVTMAGTGTLTLAEANTYTNSTIVSSGVLLLTGSINSIAGVSVTGGTLSGTGTVNDNVSVSSGGTLSPGLGRGTIGTLTINSNLTLAGTTAMDIDKTDGTNDQVIGLTGVTYGGTLVVSNLLGSLTTNDTFTLFTPGASASNFTNIIGSPGAGLKYTFTNGVLGVAVGIANNPTNISYSISGNTLTLSWPVDHLGWILQSQTNNLATGLGANWVDVAGSAASNTNGITINPASPSVFFRLRQP